MMRVLFVSDVFFPRVNGVSTSIATFRADLERLGVETLLVAPRYAGETVSEEHGVVRVAGSKVPGDPEDRRMRWGALRRALAGLERETFDLVHVHTPFVAHYAGVREARRRGVPVLATYHTFFEEYLHHYVPVLPRPLGRTLARAFTRSQCSAVQALVAPSEPLRQVLCEYGVDTPVHVIPTGLPADRFAPGNAARFRALAQLPAHRPLVTYVGRVAHEKNIDFLVRVFERVRRSVPEAMLIIAGEGPAREPLRKLVGQLGLTADVRFVGYLDRDTSLLDCYAAASVFAFASRTETQGLVLLEALAQGTPVVSTAELGTKSILAPACGAVIAEEREEPFAAAVVQVLRDADLRGLLSAQARTYARGWSSASMAARLAELYRTLPRAA
ncbi:MAG: glycosyltransferase [Gammaproteobacteria bacterium]|nr:glycosyltransferase [Gammaproteobacteria bacterium]